MDIIPFLLVIVSAITHGVWNFLAKRAGDKDIFIGLSKICEVLLFFIPFVVVLYIAGGYGYSGWYIFVLVASCFVFLNYYFLSRAYERIELSVAYPISRSSTLFLPVLGLVFIGERIDVIGIFAIGIITIAVLILQLNSFHKNEIKHLFSKLVRPGIIYALLAALTVASYTIWDKVAVSHIQPFLYFYGYTFITGALYLALLLKKFSRSEIQHEWQQHKYSIISVGILNTFTYLLILTVLGLSKASYVGALRQISLVVGVVLGRRFLDETLPFPKIISVILLIMGSILIVFAK
jgi:drug/metabolite transporter (DMT)-like permease